MPGLTGLSLFNRKEKCCDSTYSRSRPRAWLSAHSKLSVGCGRGVLRKEAQPADLAASANQKTETTYSSKA